MNLLLVYCVSSVVMARSARVMRIRWRREEESVRRLVSTLVCALAVASGLLCIVAIITLGPFDSWVGTVILEASMAQSIIGT